MANAIDYIDWRGDLSFDVSPFNEVDNLLLCRLTSLDFTGIVPVDGEMPLAEAARLYFERYGDEDRRLGVLLAPGSVTMVKRMLQSARFSRLVLADYENRVDERRELQFCAVTVLVPDSTAFVAFRGTDDTLVAWKEDFYMGSMRTVPAQEEAAAYLCRAAWRYEQPLRVGGHSKGGNLSVYAAMSAPEEVQATSYFAASVRMVSLSSRSIDIPPSCQKKAGLCPPFIAVIRQPAAGLGHRPADHPPSAPSAVCAGRRVPQVPAQRAASCRERAPPPQADDRASCCPTGSPRPAP